jgi:hypothetical protein
MWRSGSWLAIKPLSTHHVQTPPRFERPLVGFLPVGVVAQRALYRVCPFVGSFSLRSFGTCYPGTISNSARASATASGGGLKGR